MDRRGTKVSANPSPVSKEANANITLVQFGMIDQELPSQDKLYYQFIQGQKDPKRLYITLNDSHKDQDEQTHLIVLLSKKLTENAYFNEAKQFITMAFNDHPNHFQLCEEAARIHMMFMEFKQCIEFNKKAIALKKSEQDQNLSNIGLAYYEMEDYNEALNHLNQAIDKNSRNFGAKINLALVYKHMGNLDKALQILADVQMASPTETAAMINMANIYQIQGRHEQAAILYLEALDIDFNDEDALCNLGIVLSRIQYHDYAKLAFEEGINVNPGNKIILQNYLLFLLEIKHYDKFNTIMNHAKRVLETQDLQNLQKLYQDFQKASSGLASQQLNIQANASVDPKKAQSAGGGGLKSSLKNFFNKKKASNNAVKMNDNNSIKEIEEEEDKDDY
ncbi:tpr domain containing protein [Stylonychia lemnae]|uniref:Tpr domain containing protein n=1 Tax=Stylonychia lemnae TaxID=5949 RepID=A0A078A3D4_STYLE|nr:tpr domain containing protein [Stylonychia lemnae]|eukprot:CDW76023.1 tpr domain containing protein [Stylonychia lemnae]